MRLLSCETLWEHEVPAFDRATGRDRLDRVAVIRAVGVVFSETGTPEQKEEARRWLRGLLRDPEEKVRRYAMAALPKIGATTSEEAEVLAILERGASEREKRHLGRTLEKIGGEAVLATAAGDPVLGRAAQKAKANVAREKGLGGVDLGRVLQTAAGVRIHLRCRSGLEDFVEDELHESGAFEPLGRHSGLVAAAPRSTLELADVFAMRCFSSASFVLGEISHPRAKLPVADFAKAIASPLSLRIFETFSTGAMRYRLEFASHGHRRGAVREVTDRVYETCPQLLNDSRNAPWQIDIREVAGGSVVELSPRLRPDPRFVWRQADVPAASHPPLAACMARLAGPMEDDVVWDPFCGSGLELIERALRGGVRMVIGTDLSETALRIARANFDAAIGSKVPAIFACGDFRESPADALKDGGVSLVISNPPMGRRVPIANLEGLIEDLFLTADRVLQPGGRLVFANPLRVKPRGRSLVRDYRKKIDLGGFHVHLERYVKGGEELRPRRPDRSGED